MKQLSIRTFSIVLLFVTFIIEGFLFFNFYKESKDSIAHLLTQNIQTEALNLKQFLDKTVLNTEDVLNVTSYLDNILIANKLVSDIHIIDAKDKLIYSSDRETANHLIPCVSISKIDTKNVFQQSCYSISIKLYHKLTPYYLTTNLYTNQNYISELLEKHAYKYLTYYVLFLVLSLLSLLFVLTKFIIKPLERLRQYAYYNDNEPKNFVIHEIESIRYSLQMTFRRLRTEQEELYKLSTQDSLSGLYNRLSLIEKIEWLISDHTRTKSKFAVLFLDLDNFKNINDSMGHTFGDKVLIYISKLLKEVVRENDIVSRIGGDEFVIVLPQLTEETRVFELAKRLQSKLSEPVHLDEYSYQATASIGITLFPRDGQDVNTLLKNADIAMYKSKELGKNNYHFFTNSLNQIVQEKILMQRLMHNALESNYFQLYYQPKVDIASDQIVACEALIRLIDPIEGVIPPDKFIPLAEETNFIIPLGQWIIKESIQQIREWQKKPLLKEIKVSVNLSAKQFVDTTLTRLISHEIKDIDVKKLDIELTESVLATDFEDRLRIINTIKSFGITLSLDDFGTGYSSLSYLKTIPFDTIKIDKTFIDDLLDDAKDKSFVSMIINIAKSFQLEVVAEGVETKEQRDILKELACETYQGYLCSKPLPAKEFEELIKRSCHTSN